MWKRSLARAMAKTIIMPPGRNDRWSRLVGSAVGRVAIEQRNSGEKNSGIGVAVSCAVREVRRSGTIFSFFHDRYDETTWDRCDTKVTSQVDYLFLVAFCL